MKKKLIDYIDFKLVGECEIDVSNVIKCFNLCCRIFKSDNEYQLVEYSPKMKTRRIKVAIHEEDALKIIDILKLQPFRSGIFRNLICYVPVGIA